jgi:hypothetical protein
MGFERRLGDSRQERRNGGVVMKYASISAIAALMMCPAVAMAASPQLKGDYAVTGFASCQHSTLQFTTDGVV